MATLSAWLFDTPDGAAQAENLLLDLQKQQVIVVQDAATVSWPQGQKKPKTKELTSAGWVGASMGGLWGLLFGLLFFVPLLGVAIGAGTPSMLNTAAPPTESSSVVTTPPCRTPVIGSPTSSRRYGTMPTAMPRSTETNLMPSSRMWGEASAMVVAIMRLMIPMLSGAKPRTA